MTYFGFLAVFILIPILLLALMDIRSARKQSSQSRPGIGWAIGIHIVLALIYTTPWDNYLVATHVWYYSPKLVSGIVIGYVPLEEYLFFILETLLAGLWLYLLTNRINAVSGFKPSVRLRVGSVSTVILIWLAATFIYTNHWKSATYLSIILFWALPAIIPQLAFGADILWHHRKLLFWSIVPIGLYLSFSDALAIASGTWTIDPAQSTGIFIGSLPLEETVFFFVTATLICFGVVLLLATESQPRWIEIEALFKRFPNRT
jgi:lycopene cyclase domain-containing protein